MLLLKSSFYLNIYLSPLKTSVMKKKNFFFFFFFFLQAEILSSERPAWFSNKYVRVREERANKDSIMDFFGFETACFLL